MFMMSRLVLNPKLDRHLGCSSWRFPNLFRICEFHFRERQVYTRICGIPSSFVLQSANRSRPPGRLHLDPRHHFAAFPALTLTRTRTACIGTHPSSCSNMAVCICSSFWCNKRTEILDSQYLGRGTILLTLKVTVSLPYQVIFNFVVSVYKRTIPTEWPPLVGYVNAKFCEQRVSRGERDGSLRPYSRFSGPEPQFLLSSSSSVVLTRLSGPHSRPITSQKMSYHRESNPDLWICSQELWPLDHRGVPHEVIECFN
jgi:hypothetical protein